VSEFLIKAQRMARPVVCQILRNRPDDVDDVLQDATIKALRAESRMCGFRGDCAFTTWFTTIARNTALMLIRTKENRLKEDSKSLSIEDFDIISSQETPEQFVLRSEREGLAHEIVHRAIKKLSPSPRRAAYRWLSGEKILNGAEKAARHQVRTRLRMDLQRFF
jgi:RNA polymerase sigma factor (sigma-70 family)